MKNSFFTSYHINKNRKIDFFVDFVSIILALLYGLLFGNFVLSALITSVGILGILDTLDYPISSHILIKNNLAFIFAILWIILLLLSAIFKQQLVLIITLGIGTILFMLTSLGIGKGKQ